MEISDIEKRFTYRPSKIEVGDVYHDIRVFALEFAKLINELCPDGREKSLAITRIEEAMFWANSSIARNGEISE